LPVCGERARRSGRCSTGNEPAIRFYRALGAQPLEEWTVMRVTGAALSRLAASDASNLSPAPASKENGRTEP
jgi:hypothetical protein